MSRSLSTIDTWSLKWKNWKIDLILSQGGTGWVNKLLGISVQNYIKLGCRN